MTICTVLQIYSAMAGAHVGTKADHVEIQKGEQYLQVECKKVEDAKKEKASKKGEDKE